MSTKGMMFQDQIEDLQEQLKKHNPEKKILRKLDLFVLDNSLRETGFGHLRGHTPENKWKIYNEVRKVGFKHIIVESFNHLTRLGDTFIRQLVAKNEKDVNYYAFTDFIEEIDENGIPQEEVLPIGLPKMKELGIHNIIIELDLVYHGINYKIFNGKRLCGMLSRRLEWVRKNLSKNSLIFVNIRDFAETMKSCPRRVFYLVNYLATLPPNQRILGITFDDDGDRMAEELAVWTHCVRQEMDKGGWTDGQLLVHVQEKFGMANMIQLDCLANGATGICAGLCQEGSALGHASSCLTLMNLIRIGNQKIQKKFNCVKIRDAARAITVVTTGKHPDQRRPVIGDRALDIVFRKEPVKSRFYKEFNLAEFLGENEFTRISARSTTAMLRNKLRYHYPPNADFTIPRAKKMRQLVHEDLDADKREDYNSNVGIARLYERAGGTLTKEMKAAFEKAKAREPHQKKLRSELRVLWDEWDIRDGVKDDEVELDAFFNGFMAPYFGCYRSDESKSALRAIDVDSDGKVHWDEFGIYMKWAGHQYPEIQTAEELLDYSFRKGLVPAMQYEMYKDKPIRIYLDEGEDADLYKSVYFDGDVDFLGPS